MMIKLFEAFAEETQFPDNFNNRLLRKVNLDYDKYIDDPSKRKVRIGDSNEPDYEAFCKNFVNVGVQDPTKSVHMFLTEKDQLGALGRCGYVVIPEKNANFSFGKFLDLGGLGNTYFFPHMVYEKFLRKKYTGILWQKYEVKELFRRNKNEYIRLVTEYQQELFDLGVIGNLTYDELFELCHKNPITQLHIWTESQCLHIKNTKERRALKNRIVKPELPITSYEVMDILGLKPSRELGRVMKTIQEMFSKNPDITKDEIIKIIKNL